MLLVSVVDILCSSVASNEPNLSISSRNAGVLAISAAVLPYPKNPVPEFYTTHQSASRDAKLMTRERSRELYIHRGSIGLRHSPTARSRGRHIPWMLPCATQSSSYSTQHRRSLVNPAAISQLLVDPASQHSAAASRSSSSDYADRLVPRATTEWLRVDRMYCAYNDDELASPRCDTQAISLLAYQAKWRAERPVDASRALISALRCSKVAIA